MKKKRFNEEQIIGALKKYESGVKTIDICREYGIAQNTFYAWRSKFSGMEVSDARKLRSLEQENSKLKRVVADLTLECIAYKDVLSKKY